MVGLVQVPSGVVSTNAQTYIAAHETRMSLIATGVLVAFFLSLETGVALECLHHNIYYRRSTTVWYDSQASLFIFSSLQLVTLVGVQILSSRYREISLMCPQMKNMHSIF